MLKRVTKVTSLLMAAASIVSMVPAMATDIKKIEAQEGVIYDASSKAGGIFVIDGEINGDTDRAIYLLKDGKYTKLDDAEPGDEIGGICEKKYLEMTQSDGDVYYVDITTGKETDEYSREVDNSQIARKVRNKIKKDNDGRISEDSIDTLVTADTTVRGDGSGNETMWGITGKWRQYFYSLDKPFTISGVYSKEKETIYSDNEGNYIDVDYNLGSIGVSTTTGSSVTINNTDDTYDIEEDGDTYELKAQINNGTAWDEGPKYIVRTAELTILKKRKGAPDSDYKNVTDEVELGSKAHHFTQATNADNSVTVIQTIFKEQDTDTIDGIKYPKDVKTYFSTDEDGNSLPLLGLKDTSSSEHVYNGVGLHAITGGTQGYNVSFYYDFVNKKVYSETLNYKSKSGYNYIDVDEYDETDCDSFKLGCGDVWVLGDSYVKRFNDKENKFEKLYRVDGGMTNLHCSLPTDIVVWNEDKEIYSIVYPETSTTANDETIVTNTITTTDAAVKVGWTKETDGTWNYTKSNGIKAIGWLKDSEAWYYLKTDGIMATGWINDVGTWYYLNSSGVMQTGWINDNEVWYYLDESGAMLYNAMVNGYVLGSNGALVSGN